MPVFPINIGTTANDGTGDHLRDAFEKCNLNWDYIESIIPGTSVIAYQSSPGDPAEDVLFYDAALVQQNCVLPSANSQGAQKTIVFKIDSSSNLVHITATTGSFGGGITSIDLTVKGESVALYPNSSDNVWYQGRI